MEICNMDIITLILKLKMNGMNLMIHLLLKFKVLLIGVRMYAFYFTKKSIKV